AAAVLFVAGLAIGLYLVSGKESELRAAQNERNELDEDVKKLEEVTKRVNAVQAWENKGVNWLDEFYDITAAFPDIAKTELVELDGQYVDPPKGATKKYSAKLKLQIYTDAANPKAGALSTYLSMSKDHHRDVTMVQANGPAGPFRTKYNVEMTI